MFPRLYVEGSIMHNRNYTEQDAIQRLLLFEEGLSGIIGLMKEEKKAPSFLQAGAKKMILFL